MISVSLTNSTYLVLFICMVAIVFFSYRACYLKTPKSAVKRTTRDYRHGRKETRVMFANNLVAVYAGTHSYKTDFSKLRPVEVFRPHFHVKSGHVPYE